MNFKKYFFCENFTHIYTFYGKTVCISFKNFRILKIRLKLIFSVKLETNGRKDKKK